MRGDGAVWKEVGVAGYLTKPVSRKELLEAVTYSIGRLNSQEEPDNKLITRHFLRELNRSDQKILLVEDYVPNQRVAIEYLRRQGLSADLAENGKQAVAMVKEKNYDLVFMDVQMPEMDGYQATKEIRKLEEQRNKKTDEGSDGPVSRLPIVAMTAFALKGDMEKCLSVGMDDYLSKPIRKNALIAMLEKWLKTSKETKGQRNAKELIKSSEELAEELSSLGKEPVVVDEELADIVPLFIDQAKDDIVTMFSALEDEDLEKICSLSHSLKGAGGGYGIQQISDMSSLVEIAGKTGDKGEIKFHLKRLENYISGVEIIYK